MLLRIEINPEVKIPQKFIRFADRMILTAVTPEQIGKINCGLRGFAFSKKVFFPAFECFVPAEFLYECGAESHTGLR